MALWASYCYRSDGRQKPAVRYFGARYSVPTNVIVTRKSVRAMKNINQNQKSSLSILKWMYHWCNGQKQLFSLKICAPE
ncbi:hypothetical protein A5893_02290 [Pedobacter psychrophilus]|uniref:Uncharacterized protein n=1 Tax=Pedobacter psychrophilus TaxID=1826909 RepID=A0A179DN52_9SPHI|nr:hypothetical protein A5893_02290 [Pedobacter psychrophilus]